MEFVRQEMIMSMKNAFTDKVIDSSLEKRFAEYLLLRVGRGAGAAANANVR